MYKVYFDGTLVSAPYAPKLQLIDPVIDLKEGQPGSFVFSMPPDHPFYDDLALRDTEVSVFSSENTENPVFCGFAVSSSCDLSRVKTVECVGDLAWLGDTIQRPHRYSITGADAPRQLLQALLTEHNAQENDQNRRFTVGNVTVTDPNGSIACFSNYDTTLTCIQEDLLDDLGGFLRVRYSGGVKYLDYLTEAPKTAAQKVQLGRNLLTYAQLNSAEAVATACIPLGAMLDEEHRTAAAVENLDERLSIRSVNGGVDYVYNQAAVDTFGWVFRVVTWDEVTTAAALKAKGEKWLTDNQFESMTIEAEAVDLGLIDGSVERLELSDDVPVVSVPHGVNRAFRLTQMTIYLNDYALNRVLLGVSNLPSLTGMLAGGGKVSGSSSGGSSAASTLSIQSGVVLITPSAANTPTYVDVEFPTAFASAPTVVATPLSTVPGTAVLGCGVSNVTATGCRIYLTRTNTTTTSVSWIAVAQGGSGGGGGDVPAEVTISQSGAVLTINNVASVGSIAQSGSTLVLS